MSATDDTDEEPSGAHASPGRSARELLATAKALRTQAHEVLASPDEVRSRARAAFESARGEVISRQLNDMPIARLRDTTEGGVRLGLIEAAGYSTVGAVLRASPRRLMQIRGVGDHSATQVFAAARQLEHVMKDALWLRFETDRRPHEQRDLIAMLAAHELAEKTVAPIRDELNQVVDTCETLEIRAARTSSRMRLLFSRRKSRTAARQALAQLSMFLASAEAEALTRKLDAAAERLDAGFESPDIWNDYDARVAAFNGLLIEISGLSPDDGAAEGFLPAEIARLVHDHPLNTSLLRVSLRGYQAFGAKFALQQRSSMLGDEMGLGKTIEALAAMCHLQIQGATHFLVVCPASVLVNWLHEIDRHSVLAPVRLHGSDRAASLRTWTRRGGVAVTTFQSLGWLIDQHADVTPALLVVDEAHYVKNPSARRTIDVGYYIERSDRTLFLTGTPMENRVEEFRALVGHLRPKVARSINPVIGLAGAAAFRAAVAPVYLRRNQTDVLQELPPRIETEEWVTFAGEDLHAYRSAVAKGNFMAMRQAAYAPAAASGSAKLARLIDLVDEATANDRKVVIFSFFRGVIDAIADILGNVAIGPITGSVQPAKRQKLVDDFTDSAHACALISQIEAGGVGLNIQAASVVILAEPQSKPSIEEQAIARAHRMGQARPVDVHRLLAEDTVDQRMLEILATKAALFDEYVRRSALTDVSPDAVDISDLEATKQVVSVAEEERRIIELERRRLGLTVGQTDGGGSAQAV